MKVKFILLITATLMAFHLSAQSFKVMSYNIRYDSPQDAEQGYGWKHRKEQISKLINHYKPDLLGVQEAEKHQLDYLLESLPDYDFVGVGRTDGKEEGEYSAILYSKKRFTVLKNGTFWLSTTPENPSKGWDAAYPRIVTWTHLKDMQNYDELYYFNTHFDHVGEKARVESARLIKEKINEITSGVDVIISGDFNVTPDSEPYEILSATFPDARMASKSPAYGPSGTFSGFDLRPDSEFRRIDYIFVSGFTVLTFETIADFADDKFPSDHLPIITELIFTK